MNVRGLGGVNPTVRATFFDLGVGEGALRKEGRNPKTPTWMYLCGKMWHKGQGGHARQKNGYNEVEQDIGVFVAGSTLHANSHIVCSSRTAHGTETNWTRGKRTRSRHVFVPG